MLRHLSFSVIVMLAGLSGFLEQWIPSIIPTEWAEIAPLEWEVPTWQDTTLAIAEPAAPLDPESVDGFLPQRILNTEVGVQARFLLTPDRSGLNDDILERMHSLIAAQESKSGDAYVAQAHDTLSGLENRGCMQGSTLMPLREFMRSPDLAPPRGEGVAVTCDVMTANGPIFTQRIRTVEVNDDETRDTVMTLVTDTVHNQTVTGAQMWNSEASEELWQAIITTLRHEARSLSLMPITSSPDEATMREVLASALPLDDGSVQIIVPAGFTAPELHGLGVEPLETPQSMTLDVTHTNEYLSGAGVALAKTLQERGSFEPPSFLTAGHRTVDCELVPCIALTYDDGPSSLTPLVLDALASHDASASFFLVGDNVSDFADAARRTVEEGHLALNHTWSHHDLVDLEAYGPTPDAAETAESDANDSDDTETAEDAKPTKKERHEAVRQELTRTNDIIEEVTGQAPNAFRPPYGEVNEEVLKIAGMPAIQWDIDTEDWKGISEDELISRAVTGAKPGSIILQHDIHENTAMTVDDIITGLEQRGFTIVNLRQLFGEMPTSGEHFSAR